MTWVPFVKRTDEDSCETCNGFGGIYDDETCEGGVLVEMQCPDCLTGKKGESRDD